MSRVLICTQIPLAAQTIHCADSTRADFACHLLRASCRGCVPPETREVNDRYWVTVEPGGIGSGWRIPAVEQLTIKGNCSPSENMYFFHYF